MEKAIKTKAQLLEEIARLKRQNAGLKGALTRSKKAAASADFSPRVLKAINRVFRKAISCDSEEGLASTCLEVAQWLTGAAFGFIGEVNEEGEFDTIAISNPGWKACQMPESDATMLIQGMVVRGIWGHVIETGEPLLTNDPPAHPESVGVPEGHPALTSYIGVPLKRGDTTFGMLSLANKVDGFEETDLQAAEQLALAVTQALSRKRAELALQRSRDNLEDEVARRSEALTRSEVQYRNFVENFRGIAFRSRIDWTPEFFHGAVEKITGYQEEDFIKGAPRWDQIVRPDDLQRLVGEYPPDAFADPAFAAEREYRIVRKDGEERWVRDTLQGVFDDAGEYVGLQGTVYDITERKRAELERERLTYGMGERVKEIGCLHDVSRVMNDPSLGVDEVLAGVANLIPPAWQFPEITSGRVTLEGETFESAGFGESGWSLSSEIEVGGEVLGKVEVFYREERPPADEGPFSMEERRLLDSLAREIGEFVERRRAIEALRESEDRLAAATEGTSDGLWDWTDVNGDEEWWSANFYRLLGYEVGEIEPRLSTFGELLHPDDKQRAFAAVDAHFERKEPFDIEYRFKTKSGKYRWFRGRGQAVFGDDGKPLRMAGSIQDIHDRKVAEEQLHIKNLVFESSIAAGSIADNQGIIHTVNDAFVELWGYKDKEDAVGNSVGDFFVNPEDAGPILQALNETGEWEGEFQAKQHDGTRFISLGYATAIKNGKGEQIGYQSANLDVTAQREAEEKLRSTLADLERSNEELQQFAYVASHDLQEPLRMVGSYVQLLEKRYADKLDDDARDFIGYAVEGANRMKALITDLLEFSRVETRGGAFEPVETGDAAREARDNLEIAIEESGAEVTIGRLPEVRADRGQLVQLFQNLIGNGIKFAREGVKPRVEVAAERVDDEWVFSVADSGIGIEEQYRDRIFVIFQRLHAKSEYGGTGIGLAICKKIAERHGGRIWVESEPGRGSTFKLALPV